MCFYYFLLHSFWFKTILVPGSLNFCFVIFLFWDVIRKAGIMSFHSYLDARRSKQLVFLFFTKIQKIIWPVLCFPFCQWQEFDGTSKGVKDDPPFQCTHSTLLSRWWWTFYSICELFYLSCLVLIHVCI